ncbi:hypothetical protein DICPUDRAFT_154328 [Dictyostelium purpureum]|uniref:NAD-dependent epimerase/dehydratase domain-containing protein n=1 Tax=Dictyostelium purpureum TaxID=5786 RepID=F0ZR21_DICPU|nr:uncharacterized protein DICPUDRAFT_154328 [Dictyostelium purpureum]EGC33595.1 hypothetical protein DICPUDRAFT_154328 [Dictyostelium purpureum]|eukprot:XP_003289863.1 hypothetical protein DICPUDRAFT_154328 [Dictyostelium purpureum]
MKENILLTGITGFVGTNLIKPLLQTKLNQAISTPSPTLLDISNKYKNNNKNSDDEEDDNLKYNVFALVREQSSKSRFLEDLKSYKNFQLIIGDFVDLNETSQIECIKNLKSIIIDNNIDIVLHLASFMTFYPTDKENALVFKTNVIGTENLLKASVNIDLESSSSMSAPSTPTSSSPTTFKNKLSLIKRFIYCSSTETMGGKKPVTGIPISEFEDRYSNPNYYYGETKRIAEDHVRRFEERFGLDTIILRPTGLFGKNDQFSMFELIQTVSYGILFFLPSFATGHCMYLHIDDFVQAIQLSLVKEKLATDDTELPHTYIITPDKGLSYKEALIFLNEKLNRMKPRLRLPASICYPAVNLLGFIMYNLPNARKPFLLKTETLKRMEEDRLYSNERAKRELGFKPKYSFKQGLNVTIEEYLENERIGYYPISPLFIFTTIILLTIKFLIL